MSASALSSRRGFLKATGFAGAGIAVSFASGCSFIPPIPKNPVPEAKDGLSWITGRKVFDEKIYYFFEIPTSVNPMMVFSVAFGAISIAVLASILPARRAARLHPVRALRFE